jgi:hypothetical protein
VFLIIAVFLEKCGVFEILSGYVLIAHSVTVIEYIVDWQKRIVIFSVS